MATNSLLYHDMPFPVFFNASAAKCPPRRPLKKNNTCIHMTLHTPQMRDLYFFINKGIQKLFHWAKKVCATTHYCKQALFRRMSVRVTINAPWIQVSSARAWPIFMIVDIDNDKSTTHQLWGPEMHTISYVSKVYTTQGCQPLEILNLETLSLTFIIWSLTWGTDHHNSLSWL